jgi:hypothetical protein
LHALPNGRETGEVDIKDLKGYGKPLNVPERLPKAVDKKIKREGMRTIRRRLGLAKMLRLIFLIRKERKRMSAQDLSFVRQKGLTSKKLIQEQVMMAAVFSAMSKMLGAEKAMEINCEIMESAGPAILENMMPKPEEFEAWDDPFDAFREYYMALLVADREAGLHDFEVVEDSADAFQLNIIYCAYCEIPKRLGIIEACQPICYSDDVFFPEFGKKLGISFVRKETLARGNDVCDFRFERKSRHGAGATE